MPATLYQKQRQVLDYISQYIQKRGYSPTLVEIAQAFNLRSLATVHEHLKNLARKGFIRRFEGVVRGIEILDQKVATTLEGIELPLLGYIKAGEPIEPYTERDTTIGVAPFLVSEKNKAYVLQVRGESMIDDGILDGDFVVVEEKNTAQNGDIVIALLGNGVATLKRFFQEKGQVRLEPANARMVPIYPKDVTIQGKVVGVIRQYQ